MNQEQMLQVSKELAQISSALRSVRIQVILLALKDSKQKHPRVIILENQLQFHLSQTSRNNPAIDDILEELDCIVGVKMEHHQAAQEYQQSTVEKYKKS